MDQVAPKRTHRQSRSQTAMVLPIAKIAALETRLASGTTTGAFSSL
jgi:hypothetical protein